MHGGGGSLRVPGVIACGSMYAGSLCVPVGVCHLQAREECSQHATGTEEGEDSQLQYSQLNCLCVCICITLGCVYLCVLTNSHVYTYPSTKTWTMVSTKLLNTRFDCLCCLFVRTGMGTFAHWRGHVHAPVCASEGYVFAPEVCPLGEARMYTGWATLSNIQRSIMVQYSARSYVIHYCSHLYL